jgi:translation initiation factor IF-3
VRLVDPDGNQLGIKTLPEALSIARELELDLVEVAPLAEPPVCRILNYGKWKYEAAQRDKESRKKASTSSIKEMKYRPKIGGGDFETKTRKVGEFIDEGHKVKITIMFRGREVAHPELGKKILDRIAEQLPAAKVEAAPKLDGRNMIMVLAPDRRVRQATQARAGEHGEHVEGAPPTATPSAANGQPGPSPAAPSQTAPTQAGPSQAGPNQTGKS